MSENINSAPARSAKEQFDKQAAHYNTDWNSWSAETLNWLLANAAPRPDDTVLDVATGTGFTALAFAPTVRSVIGLDVSPGMLSEARKRAEKDGIKNTVFHEGTAESLPFADETFDIVTSRIAPHHFLDIEAFLRETVRVLKPGGRLALIDTSVPDESPEAASWQNAVEVQRDPSHVRNYTPSEWRRMAESAGLTVLSATSADGGITIPLSDWIFKAGSTKEQEKDVRQRFTNAPDSAKEAFRITVDTNGETVFTWQRVALLAIKP